MADEPRPLLELLQHLIAETPDSRLCDRYRADKELLERFIFGLTDGLTQGELQLWNVITNVYRTLAESHVRHRAAETAIGAHAELLQALLQRLQALEAARSLDAETHGT